MSKAKDEFMKQKEFDQSEIVPEISNVEKEFEAGKREMMKVPDWWIDNYTDASGNCFSDADSGL